MYKCTCVHAYSNMHAHVYTYIYIYVDMYMHKVCPLLCIYTHIHAHICTRVYSYTHIYIYVYILVFTYMYSTPPRPVVFSGRYWLVTDPLATRLLQTQVFRPLTRVAVASWLLGSLKPVCKKSGDRCRYEYTYGYRYRYVAQLRSVPKMILGILNMTKATLLA